MLLVISCTLASSAHAARRDGRGKPHAHGIPRATRSYYIRSVHPTVLHRMGCRAGERRASGIVILDFGRLSYDGHSYGTQTFANRFAPNRAITRGMKAFARGYAFRTRDFFRGYRDYDPGYTLFNYGSLGGGVGMYWNVRQAWFVAGRALMHARPDLPPLTNIHAQ